MIFREDLFLYNASRSEFGELKQIYDESVKNTNALEAEIAGLKGEHETEKVGDD